MFSALATLLNRLNGSTLRHADVIKWGAPVPSFGNLERCTVATLGINPSNREFVDESGIELEGASRRFHTLTSLGLSAWTDADTRHLRIIKESCFEYFQGNPYDTWFRRLDQIISGTGASYYSTKTSACHLDLIPYATASKWTDLSSIQRALLMNVAGDTLALLLRESPVRVLILNGHSVVKHFQEIAGVELTCRQKPGWALPRNTQTAVAGKAYSGIVDTISGIPLRQELLVLGYNHNIQSSFGVTKIVIKSISNWVASSSKAILE